MVNKNAPRFKELYKKRKNVFKKAEVFDIDFSPESLVAREEAEVIFSKTLSFIKSRIAQHTFIYGSHGSGKTAFSKYIKEETEQLIEENDLNIQIEHINCRFVRDLWTIPDVLFRQKNRQKNKPEDKLIENLNNDLILILDEIDEANDPADFLYFISRFQEFQSKNKNKIMLILISNKKQWDKNLDSATRSSLSLKKIEFKQYNKSQVREILKQRLQSGLINQKIISDEMLSVVVNKTLENDSDLRMALMSIVMVIEEIEENENDNLSSGDIEKIYEYAVNIIQLERIGNLEDERFMILYATSISPSDNSKDIWQAYVNLCREAKVKPWGYTRFLYYADTLENQSFVKIFIGKKEEEGQRNISIKKMDIKIKKSVIKEEFENRKIDFIKNYSLPTSYSMKLQNRS